MSAAELRQAAETLRERVASLDEMGGTWVAFGTSVLGEPFKCHKPECPADHRTHILYDDEETLTAYIATMHPGVGLALADWLDTAGADLWAHGPLCECGSGCNECDDSLWEPHVRRALALARLINGGAS